LQFFFVFSHPKLIRCVVDEKKYQKSDLEGEGRIIATQDRAVRVRKPEIAHFRKNISFLAANNLEAACCFGFHEGRLGNRGEQRKKISHHALTWRTRLSRHRDSLITGSNSCLAKLKPRADQSW
jgi:hypothetical protein